MLCASFLTFRMTHRAIAAACVAVLTLPVGPFAQMASAQDLAGTAMPADFDWFEYWERSYVANV